MRILFVVNNCYVRGNGLSASAQRTIKGLRGAGFDVRVISGVEPGVEERPEYELSDFKVPVFGGIVKRQGYSFAATDYRLFREAVQWADVIHLEEPFQLERNMCRVARKAGKPITATYHLHPENLFSSIHMGWSLILNCSTMLLWRNWAFNHCRVIQCPTENARQRLVRWHFKPELRVISNGMIPRDIKDDAAICASDSEDGTFRIVTSGRYSVEKNQITLLKAMEHSRYASRIRLVIAGRGPIEKTLRRKAASLVRRGILKYEPDFGFHSLDELEQIYRKSDLYIHCANVEVEGLSCMEAIELGLVPVIATGRLTATAQYALSERSKYRAGNAKALAERIDWWLEHDAERREEARRYLGLGSQYSIDKSIEELSRMFRDVAGSEEKP